jgi:hypothetical protein
MRANGMTSTIAATPCSAANWSMLDVSARLPM